MSGDEVFVTVLSIVIGPVGWAIWIFRAAGIQAFGRRSARLGMLMATLIACAAVLLLVLTTAAAPDVRDDPAYIVMYFVLGLAWLRAAEFVFAYAGLSVRDDVIERENVAALLASSGALVGVTLCYAGGNIGAGPGWWVVVFAGALATAGLAVVWLVVDRVAGVADVVTIDRDPAAGARLGGLLASCGLILGRAVAGDWHSADATVVDFARVGWAVIPVVAAALVVERAAKPTVAEPRPPLVLAGVLPALLYCTLAAAYVVALGWPA